MGALHDEDDVGPVEVVGRDRLLRIGRQAGGGGLDAGAGREDPLGRGGGSGGGCGRRGRGGWSGAITAIGVGNKAAGALNPIPDHQEHFVDRLLRDGMWSARYVANEIGLLLARPRPPS